MHAEAEKHQHIFPLSPVRQKVVEKGAEKLCRWGRTTNVVDTEDDPPHAQIPVAQRHLAADGMVERILERALQMGDFCMRYRANGVQDLPAIRHRERDVRIFKGYLYYLHGDAAGVLVLRNSILRG